MYRLLSFLLMITGFVFLAFGGYHVGVATSQEKARHSESHEILSIHNQASKESLKEDIQNLQYEMGKTIGMLYIRKLDREIPIIEGTDEEEHAQGVGHYYDTGLPGQNKQILLSGHRDTRSEERRVGKE